MSLVSNTFQLSIVAAPTGALPTWRQGQAIGEWRQISGTNISIAAATPNPVPTGPGSPNGKVDAWTSFAVDPVTSIVYSPGGGGHVDYAGNEVNALPLANNSPSWTMARNTTTNANLVENADWYADGRPNSVHHYYAVTFDPVGRRIYSFGGAKWSNGGNTPRTASYNIAGGDWDPQATNPNTPTAMFTGDGQIPAVCGDPRTGSTGGNAYFFSASTVYKWNRATKTFSTVRNGTFSPPNLNAYYTCSAWDTARNRIFILGGGNNYQAHHLYTPDSDSIAFPTLTGARATEALTTSSGGLVYVPAIDAYLLDTNVGGGSGFIRIDASTFACTTYTTTGGASMPAAPAAGIFNKVLYVPALGGVVRVPQYSGNVWFLATDTPAATSYTTTFPATENPISQSSIWQNGGGLGWQNMQTLGGSPGRAFGTGFTGASGGGSEFDDNICHIKSSSQAFTANQFAQGVTYRAPGYIAGNNHEIELLLRFSITSGTARGYEILWSHDGWLVIVRWNGPLGNYTELASTGAPISGNGADGDVIRGEIVGSTIRAYKNGNLILTTTDSTWTTGQPGMGAWIRSGGTTISSFCWRSWSAGNI